MTRPVPTLSSISRHLISLLRLCGALSAYGQPKLRVAEPVDSVAFLRGFAVSVDLVGPIQKMVSDYGQFEGAFRVNLRDKYFPIIEAGIGKASHNDAVTKISYSSAPYFRVGIDFNLMKMKHDVNRIYGGVRYGFSSFKYDISHPGVTDPKWGGTAVWPVWTARFGDRSILVGRFATDAASPTTTVRWTMCGTCPATVRLAVLVWAAPSM